MVPLPRTSPDDTEQALAQTQVKVHTNNKTAAGANSPQKAHEQSQTPCHVWGPCLTSCNLVHGLHGQAEKELLLANLIHRSDCSIVVSKRPYLLTNTHPPPPCKVKVLDQL